MRNDLGVSFEFVGSGFEGYGSGNGDEVINISVYVPKKLSRDERKAIEALRESENFKGDTATKKSIFEKFKNYFN